jgi:hypothetical protein
MRWPIAFAPLIAVACAASRPAAIPEQKAGFAQAEVFSVGVDPAPRLGGYWSRKGLGEQLAAALRVELGAALARSGFRTGAVHPDLVAHISAEYEGSLLHHGRLVDRYRVISPQPGERLSAERYPEVVAVAVVNAMAESPELITLARAIARDAEEAARRPASTGSGRPTGLSPPGR